MTQKKGAVLNKFKVNNTKRMTLIVLIKLLSVYMSFPSDKHMTIVNNKALKEYTKKFLVQTFNPF